MLLVASLKKKVEDPSTPEFSYNLRSNIIVLLEGTHRNYYAEAEPKPVDSSADTAFSY